MSKFRAAHAYNWHKQQSAPGQNIYKVGFGIQTLWLTVDTSLQTNKKVNWCVGD